ncbi:GNAT family N-acetyltransferase [Enterococcus rotai]|uniref:GNAT family N-acetyltransferase n=1 Tax=Enterococcus rotai TaxID=118060 RepID=UPI0032B5D44B
MIRNATLMDLDFLTMHDIHIPQERLRLAIEEKRILIIEEDETIGWLRFSFFWESIPFVDMLFILEPFRRKQYGTDLMHFFEREMFVQGFKELMLSTSSEEYSQYVYLQLGFKTVGGFFPTNEPYEIVMVKNLIGKVEKS